MRQSPLRQSKGLCATCKKYAPSILKTILKHLSVLKHLCSSDPLDRTDPDQSGDQIKNQTEPISSKTLLQEKADLSSSSELDAQKLFLTNFAATDAAATLAAGGVAVKDVELVRRNARSD